MTAATFSHMTKLMEIYISEIKTHAKGINKQGQNQDISHCRSTLEILHKFLFKKKKGSVMEVTIVLLLSQILETRFRKDQLNVP